MLLRTLFFLLLLACAPSESQVGTTSSDVATPAPPVKQQQSSLIDPSGTTIATRILPPAGFDRPAVANHSFANYLRNFPVKTHGTPVLLFDGQEKHNQHVHVAVLDIDVGQRDLQQCADAVMRLRAEYLWQQKAYDNISFHFTNGFPAPYNKWRSGNRIKVSGNKVNWVASRQENRKAMPPFGNI